MAYVYFRGKPTCKHMKAWLEAYEAELLRRGLIKSNLDIWQLVGGAAASAGTHRTPGAADTAQFSTEQLRVARQMGGGACHRTRAQGFSMEHAHLMINCPCNGSSIYQWHAINAGYSGLGAAGRGSRDDGPRSGVPFPLRDWDDGIAWAKAQQKPKPTTVSTIRAAHLNLPGTDKIGNGAKRIDAAVDLIDKVRPTVIGFNELEPIKDGRGSRFARDLDAALPSRFVFVRPTLPWNENYLAFDKTQVSLVRQHPDLILPGKTGGRHLTRAEFDNGRGLTFMFGSAHLVNGTTAQHQKDRQSQAKTAEGGMGSGPAIVGMDANTPADLTAFVKGGWKRANVYADHSSNRRAASYTNYEKTKPSTNPDWSIDQQYVRGFYVVGWNVVRLLDTKGNYRQPRYGDHDALVTSLRIRHPKG